MFKTEFSALAASARVHYKGHAVHKGKNNFFTI
jgi:hypothetical protein